MNARPTPFEMYVASGAVFVLLMFCVLIAGGVGWFIAAVLG